MCFSQIRVNSFSLKKFMSLLEVAVNNNCGKASSDSGLRSNMRRSRQLETILNMVTVRNLIRFAGTSLSYWLPHIYNQVVKWLKSCVQGYNQENIDTAVQKEFCKAQEPKFKRLKNRKNLRTTGFNFCNNFYSYKGKQSVHSTSCVKEGTQANKLFVNSCRSFTTKILSKNMNERVMATELKHLVDKCKNKDGRYGNLIQIIGSFSTIHLAYLMIKSNPGISAKKIDKAMIERLSLKTLQRISQDVLSCTIKFSPVRLIYIQNSGKFVLHPFGVINLSEKIVQKAMEMVLTLIFEEIFLDCSHRFRPGRSCHNVLKHLQLKIGNASIYSNVILGKIKDCFDNIPHDIIMKGLKRKIDCPNTLILVKRILNAGYILDENLKKVVNKNAKVFKTHLGIPLGIVLRSLFSNIILHELDFFIQEKLKIEYMKGEKSKVNLTYRKLRYHIKSETDLKKRSVLINDCFKIKFKNFHDPDFKRFFYVRYFDEWIILFAGNLKEARVILNEVSKKLQSLGLILNTEKSCITSLKNGKFRFLDVDFFIRKNTNIYMYNKAVSLVKKNTTIYQKLILNAPIFELLIKLKDKGLVKRNHKGAFFPIGKNACISLTHQQILNYFNSLIRGILNYYSCVHNRKQLWSVVRFLNFSCALTLARKFKLNTLAKTFKKFGRDLTFQNETGKKYKIFRFANFRMLQINERFKVNENS